MQRQNGLCAACGYRFPQPGELNAQPQLAYSPTFDHVFPRSQGGSDDVGNFRLVHSGCNRARGDGNGPKPAPTIPRALRQTLRTEQL
jgi:5-methylcytosine-specific restriction endonuclease McrA